MKRYAFCEGWSFHAEGKSPRGINLPHDAMQEQGRCADAPSGRGEAFFSGGLYIYEKCFQVPEEWRGQDVFIEFEGVMPTARVFLNGAAAGGCAYGYSLFRIELSGLRYGEENTLRVEVDDRQKPVSRWYPGAGIYRPVWLLVGPRAHIHPDGVRVTTVSYAPAEILVETAHTGLDSDTVCVEVFDKDLKVAEGSGETLRLSIPGAQLWSADHPALYQCVVTLKRDGVPLDTHTTRFGIRQIAWSPSGLTVNGETVLLKGGCVHHDNGILGARSFAESEWRRVKRLKDWGFNAIRSAHNPMCRAALEACDALGMYVMDEAWDMWDKSKSAHDYASRFQENYQPDLRSLVGKDYNHPSVILYSIGNEVTEPAKPEGVELAEKIVRTLKALDATRPITIGLNLMLVLMASMGQSLGGGSNKNAQEKIDSTAYNKMVSEMGARMVQAAAREDADQVTAPVFSLLDIAGYNYAQSRYEMDGALHPDRIIVGSETFPQDLPGNWALVEKLPYLVGDFMWTAWDYLGEVGLGAWAYDYADGSFDKNYPWLLADSGALDILGNDTAEAGMAAAVWGNLKTPYIGVRPVNHPGVEPIRAIWRGTNAIPHWSWKGCEGNDAVVEVWSSGHEAELFINGRSAGRAPVCAFKAEFRVKYEAGELKAVVYDANGRTLGKNCLHSASGKTRICITAEPQMIPDSHLIYLDISLTGENGEIECNRDTKLHVSVEGGELLAFGSADPKTEESFLAGEYTTYYGRSQAVVLAKAGSFTVRVFGEGLENICAVIEL